MRTRPLGSEGISVGEVGFGGMPLSIRGRPSEKEAARVLHAAFDLGENFVDTADVYCLNDTEIGHNERLIRQALAERGGGQGEIFVATKGGMTRPQGRWEHSASPRQLREACERSLLALGRDRIDLYYLHAPDPKVPFAESVGALGRLKEEGKIRWIGLSNVSVAQIEEASARVSVTAVQNRLNPFFREAIEEGVVDHCERQGIAFVAYSPVGGGRLNRKLPSHPLAKSIAERLECSAHAVVLAWVLAQGRHVLVIPGARTVEHVHDAATASDLSLSESDLALLDGAKFSRE